MKIDLQIPDSWHKANAVYREALALGNGGYGVQTYLGLRHALWEVCTQLAQLQPNRRTIVYAKEAAPIFESVAVPLSREGFRLRAFSEAELRNPSAWMESAQKDLLFVLTELDDPVTGELYGLSELREALKDKKCYSVHVSHSWHSTFAPEVPLASEIQILSLRPNRAIAVVGDRVRITPPVSTGLSWPDVSLPEAKNDLARETGSELLQRIEELESQPPASGERLLPAGKSRLPDRALIAFRDVDGLSLAAELARELGLQLLEPGTKSEIETTSLCRWQDERVFQGLVAKGYAPEVLRGLLILSANLLNRTDLKSKIEIAHANITKAQSGS